MPLRALISFTLSILFAVPAFADEASHKVMDRWVGHWVETAPPSGASGDAKHDEAEAAWALDDTFVQGATTTGAGKKTGVWLLNFDEKAGKFKLWFFSRLGVSNWTGTWNDTEQKMTWEGIQSPSGAKLTGFTRFTADRQEWQVHVDDAGKTTTDSGSLERTK
jgi:hypothetical protein